MDSLQKRKYSRAIIDRSEVNDLIEYKQALCRYQVFRQNDIPDYTDDPVGFPNLKEALAHAIGESIGSREGYREYVVWDLILKVEIDYSDLFEVVNSRFMSVEKKRSKIVWDKMTPEQKEMYEIWQRLWRNAFQEKGITAAEVEMLDGNNYETKHNGEEK